MDSLKLQSPWVSYTNKIRELFKRDREIRMTWSDETLELKMYVDNPRKAKAISKILPAVKVFDKTIVKIYIIPSNNEHIEDTEEEITIKDAFIGNPVFSYTRSFYLQTNPITYVVFAKEVIQYYNDDLDDLFCAKSCLAEDLARDVFVNLPATHFCTDIK